MRLAILALAAFLAPALAMAGELPDPRGPGAIPLCDAPSVVSAVIARQNWAEANTWQDGKRIAGVTHIRQRYATTKGMSLIEHRHCQARAQLDNGRTEHVYYVISQRGGFVGLSWGLDVCLPSQDYYKVYDADCRVLR
ncbi:hypothetical protein [Chthonobacter albigriseus]|uniref:hypothetical protein n=1 Tax=Chthonobacter albigriseus TaxID=1683161 RepID=UPI0015EEBA58|nr:hypothetical protein [Chthonobacter albigriseus]